MLKLMNSYMAMTLVHTIKHMAVMEDLKIKHGHYHIITNRNYCFHQENDS